MQVSTGFQPLHSASILHPFPHRLMWLTGLLQSLAPVLPPMDRNRKVYIVPGGSPVTMS